MDPKKYYRGGEGPEDPEPNPFETPVKNPIMDGSVKSGGSKFKKSKKTKKSRKSKKPKKSLRR